MGVLESEYFTDLLVVFLQISVTLNFYFSEYIRVGLILSKKSYPQISDVTNNDGNAGNGSFKWF